MKSYIWVFRFRDTGRAAVVVGWLSALCCVMLIDMLPVTQLGTF